MGLKSELYTRLTTHVGLSALISTRAYVRRMPQDVTYPAVSFTVTNTERFSAMGSDLGVVKAAVQVDAWAESETDCVALVVQVLAALQRWGNATIIDVFIMDQWDLYDDTLDIFQTAIDIEVNYYE